MNVAVLGLGYVGCLTACCLARDGQEVIGVDRGRRVGIVGLAFKPTTDDLRESPMVIVAHGALTKQVERAAKLAAVEVGR